MQQPKTHRAISLLKKPLGWVMVEYKISEDGKVVSKTETEPDLRSIALEKFALKSASFWTPDE